MRRRLEGADHRRGLGGAGTSEGAGSAGAGAGARAEAAASQAPERRQRLGVAEWFAVGERERAERVADSLRALGIRDLRTGVSWADWHLAEGADWYRWLLPRLARDFELLPCLHRTPPSLGLAPTVASPPRRTRDFADFVDAFLEEFGDLVDAVELWDEPTAPAGWDARLDPGGRLFGEMLIDAGNWARVRGKRTVLGGVSPLDGDWLARLADRGVLDFFDAVGVDALAAGTGPAEAVARVRAVLDRHELPCEIWIDAAGCSTWRGDEPGQLRAFCELLDAPAARVYWRSAEDLPPARGFPADPRDRCLGLHDADGAPKLLARTLAQGGTPLVRTLARAGAEAPRRLSRRVSLVTGGAGFVGTNVAWRLLEEGRRVRILDSLARPGSERNLLRLRERFGGERLEVQLGDVRDPVAVQRAVVGAERVFHFAAQVAVTTSLDAPVHDFEVNAAGTVRLLEALRRLPEPPPLVFTSTNKVYGSLADVELERVCDRWLPVDERLREHGVDERRPLDFCTPYGCSKGAADQYVLDWAKSFGVPTTVFRMSCIYGPHQHGNEDQGWVAHFLLRALDGGEITLYGDGAQVRDVLFVDDLVEAMLVADRAPGRAFNVGGGPDRATSLLELVDLIEELHGRRPDVRFAEERPGDQRWYVSDPRALGEATGWRPRVGVEEGVEELYRWLAGERRPAVARAGTA